VRGGEREGEWEGWMGEGDRREREGRRGRVKEGGEKNQEVLVHVFIYCRDYV
jgi:hypothetical protein